MKSFSKIIFIISLLLTLTLPVLMHAATSITVQDPTTSPTDYTAHFTVAGVPVAPTTVKVYARIKEYESTSWNYDAMNGSLTTITHNSLGNTFNATFSFANLGIVANKKYIYYLANGTTDASLLLTNPVCFTTEGPLACTAVYPVPPAALGTSSFVLSILEQAADPNAAGKYIVKFSVGASPSITTSIPITIKLFAQLGGASTFLKEATFLSPTTPNVMQSIANGLDAGDYTAQLYATTTKVSEEILFHVVAGTTGGGGTGTGTTTPPTSGGGGTVVPPTVGGVSPIVGSDTGVDFSGATVGGVVGACGAADGSSTPSLTSSSANLCSKGTAIEFLYDGFNYSWKCKGSDGTTVSCSATGGVDTNYGDNFLKNPLAPGLDTFPKIFAAVYNNIILPIAVPIIVIAIMYAGFKFVVARKQGNVDGYAEAKRILKYTLIGTALILGGWVIANALQGTLNSLLGPGGIT